jgi:AAA15 family ATPase/GTPase
MRCQGKNKQAYTMLKKLHITNFLSCKNTEIELDDITALIGRNAAGKTNILKAIQWCAQVAVGNVPIYEYSDFDMEPNYCIEFLIDNNIFKYKIKISLDYSDHIISLMENLSCYINDEWQLIAEREDDSATHYSEQVINVEINAEAPMISSLLSLLPQKKLNPFINKVFQYLSGIKYYILDDYEYRNADQTGYSDHINANNYKQWLSKKNKVKSSIVMRLLHLWNEDKDLLDELQTLIGENGLNLVKNIEIDWFEYSSKDEDNFYTVKFHMANAVVNYTQLSYGTQRVLTLLLALLYDKNSTLLIEQPEDGIHSGLLRKLLAHCFEYAKVYNKQLIIATHSPEVINLLPPESIRLVRMTEDGTKVSSLNSQQVPFILEYIENEGSLFDFIVSMDDD